MANISNNQRGVSIIAAIFIIVILAFMGVMFVSFVNTSSLTSVNDLQSTQALYAAQGGVEYIMNFGTFPNFSMGGVPKSLSATGQFLTSTPAYLTAPVGLGNLTISVNSTAGFYAGSAVVPGWIVIDGDPISYTGTSGGNTFTGVASIAVPHVSGLAVYPVASLTTNLANNCTSPVNIQSSYASNNFLMPGIVTIGTEMFYCTGATIGPPGSFNNCTRCYQGSVSAFHATGTGNIFQYIVTSTGTVGNAQRTVKAGVSNSANAAVLYDSRAQPGGFANQSMVTWPHTITAGRVNRMLIVGVSLYSTPTPSVTSVTYNSIPLTLLTATNDAGSTVRVEQWGLVAPPAGAAYPVVVNLSGPAALSAFGSIALYRVNQANPVDVAPIDSVGTNNAPSLTSITNTMNAMVVDTLAAMRPTTTINNTVCVGQTWRWNALVSSGTSTYFRGAGSYKAAGAGAPPVSVPTCWTLSAIPPNYTWAYSAVTIRPQGLAVIDWRELVN